MIFLEIRLTENFINEISFYSTKAAEIKLMYNIRCDPTLDRNFFEDPYIKIGNSDNWTKSTKSVRVHLVDMGLNYTHRDGKDNFKLNSTDKKNLNKILKCHTTYREDEGLKFTVAEAIIDYLQSTANTNGKTIPNITTIDFTKCYVREGKE